MATAEVLNLLDTWPGRSIHGFPGTGPSPKTIRSNGRVEHFSDGASLVSQLSFISQLWIELCATSKAIQPLFHGPLTLPDISPRWTRLLPSEQGLDSPTSGLPDPTDSGTFVRRRQYPTRTLSAATPRPPKRRRRTMPQQNPTTTPTTTKQMTTPRNPRTPVTRITGIPAAILQVVMLAVPATEMAERMARRVMIRKRTQKRSREKR
ncbi:hypothetical protein L209DRAFT_110118 [Thermothelomyces heterothallicus CBS 203.75]